MSKTNSENEQRRREKPYYSVRTGKHPTGGKFDLRMLCKMVAEVYSDFSNKGYFQEYFGIDCTDDFIAGKAGEDVGTYVFRLLRKEQIWPIHKYSVDWSEEDAFDMIEFLYDHATKPVSGTYHNWNQCGYHYDMFESGDAGREELRLVLNSILADYKDGFQLLESGEIVHMADTGMEPLLLASLPVADESNITKRVESAIRKFRNRGATIDDRRDAIRDLADVLEYLRPQLQQIMNRKDESDLFNIVNNFGIRHHNERQKTEYDKPVWFSWMFYYYLATIHAAVRLIEEREKGNRH